MKKTIVILAASLWLLLPTGQSVNYRAQEKREEAPELEAVVKKAEAEGYADKIESEMAVALGLNNVGGDAIPAKSIDDLETRTAGVFSHGGKIWLAFSIWHGDVDNRKGDWRITIYLTQADGVLRGAIYTKGKGWIRMPLSDAAEEFAREKSFWKKYVSKVSKP